MKRTKKMTLKPANNTISRSSLAPHLELFAKAVAEGHSHVGAAEKCGRSRGSASDLYNRPGVKARIEEFRRIKESANEKEVAENVHRMSPVITITRNHIINGLHQEAMTAQSSCARVNAWLGLADIFMLRPKNVKEVSEFYGWTEDELQEYARTAVVPERIRSLLEGSETPSVPTEGTSKENRKQ